MRTEYHVLVVLEDFVVDNQIFHLVVKNSSITIDNR